MKWTKEQRELPPLDISEDDMMRGLKEAENTPGCFIKTQGDCNFAARLACRERQLTAALSENERLRSQLTKDDTQMGELAGGGVDQVRDALRKISAEVTGWLGIERVRLCGILGYTNVAVMEDRLAIANAALAPPSGEQAAAVSEGEKNNVVTGSSSGGVSICGGSVDSGEGNDLDDTQEVAPSGEQGGKPVDVSKLPTIEEMRGFLDRPAPVEVQSPKGDGEQSQVEGFPVEISLGEGFPAQTEVQDPKGEVK